jgi:hypothetical protein
MIRSNDQVIKYIMKYNDTIILYDLKVFEMVSGKTKPKTQQL